MCVRHGQELAVARAPGADPKIAQQLEMAIHPSRRKEEEEEERRIVRRNLITAQPHVRSLALPPDGRRRVPTAQ